MHLQVIPHWPASPRIQRFSFAFAIAALMAVSLHAQIPGRNVNMVAGDTWPDGDPFLQRQNEPAIAASTRNPLHLMAGSNDYRTVDLPGIPGDDLTDGVTTGDAWLGLYKSFDGGQRWISTLLPGYPQDQSPVGLASPIRGYQAGADPVLRAGTSGLLYYAGLAFNRGENGKSAVFLARFIDNNNQEAGDSFAYLGTSIVASSTGLDGRFLDKPWMAVDIPRGNNPPQCVVSPAPGSEKPGLGRGRWRSPRPTTVQRVAGGTVYVVYSSITGEGAAIRSEIYLTSSSNCGATWGPPMRVSRPEDPINQGATMAIDPRTGNVFVAWRRFGMGGAADTDSLMVARLPVGAKKLDTPGFARRFAKGQQAFARVGKLFEHRKSAPTQATSLAQFDQGTSAFSFRSNAYPTLTFDGNGRLYMAWSERGFGLAPGRQSDTEGDARIVMTTTVDGRAFTKEFAVDNEPQGQAASSLIGHQIMPTLAFAGGKMMLVYYDLRETRAQVFGPFVSDQGLVDKRQTMDVRAAMATPGVAPTFKPVFEPSVQVSDYLFGYRNKQGALEQLQVSPPNLPMFKQGTVPFIGDYIDVAAAPAFVPTPGGGWAYNTAATATPPTFHAVWTDNRDVRAPQDGNWANYTPPVSSALRPQSLLDGSTTVPQCVAGNAGSRNQNIYTSRITGGLLVGSPGNSKPLSTTLQRGFVVFAQNQTSETRSFRMTVLAQPVGGRASFEQFPQPPYTAASPPPVTFIDMKVPPKSTASRTLYVTSSDPHGQVSVDVSEIAAPGAPVVPGGLTGRVVLNPDIENPDIENPDIENPDIENPDIENAEVYNPDIENPDIENPDIENPDIENPDIENPDIENVIVANPDIENVGVGNPDIENPDIENPDIENPDIENPDIENGAITDISWTVTNTGNTTAAFNVNLFLAGSTVPTGVQTQLLLHKVYKTPVAAPNGCDLRFESQNILLSNVANPSFITSQTGGLPDQNDASEKNATIWLAPGEIGRITLRVQVDDASVLVPVLNAQGETVLVHPELNPQTVLVPAVSSQAVDDSDPPDSTEPPIVTPTGSNLFFVQQPITGVATLPLRPVVRVQVRDTSGAVVAGVAVTLTLANNPILAAITGSTAVTGVDGLADFPGLVVHAPAAGFTLMASATAFGATASALSSPFTIVPPPLNAPPIADSLSITVNEDEIPMAIAIPGRGGSMMLTGSDSETPVANLAFTIVTPPAHGSLSGVPPLVTYAPAPNYNGPDGFTFVVADRGDPDNCGTPIAAICTAALTSAPATVSIAVTPVNDAPAFAGGPDVTVLDNVGPYRVVGWATGMSPGPVDESGQTTSFAVVTFTNPSLFAVPPTIDPGGELRFTPAYPGAGTSVVNVVLVDNGGTAAGGSNTSSPAVFTITVNRSNVAPVAAGDGYSTSEDTRLIVPARGVLANDSDANGDSLSAIGMSPPSFGSISFAADGSFIYDPNRNFNGVDSFTYKAYDGALDSNVVTVTITVTAVNDGPGFTPGPNQNVAANSGAHSVPGWATSISSGPPDEAGQSVAFTVSPASPLFSVQPAVSPTGTLTFTAAPGMAGAANFTITLTDDGGTANGGVNSLSTTFSITVDPPPVTVVGPAGGPGGSAFGPTDCAANSVVVGLLGRAGQDIDQTNLSCAPLVSGTLGSPTTIYVVGGGGGSDYGSALTCASGGVVTGVYGTTHTMFGNAVIDTLGVTCRNLATGAMSSSGTVATPNGTAPFSLACPGGTKVVGLQGRQGALMDQIAIRCR